jgi:hypothetical protein
VAKINRILDPHRGLNKTLLFAVISGLGAFVGSAIGIVVNPFHNPSGLHVLVWDSWIGLGIGLSVAIVQNWYLDRLEVAAGDLAKAAALSTIGGFFGGMALLSVKTTLTILFSFWGAASIPHIAGWTAEGLVIALVVSRAIPNLKMISAVAAGTIAGFLGGMVTNVGFPVTLADALKGVFVALSLAVVERVTRQAWLVLKRDEPPVSAGAGRSLRMMGPAPTLLLGHDPIRIGSSPDCQVVVKDGGPPLRGELTLLHGEVHYRDFTAGTSLTLKGGQSLRFGDLTVEIETSTEGP